MRRVHAARSVHREVAARLDRLTGIAPITGFAAERGLVVPARAGVADLIDCASATAAAAVQRISDQIDAAAAALILEWAFIVSDTPALGACPSAFLVAGAAMLGVRGGVDTTATAIGQSRAAGAQAVTAVFARTARASSAATTGLRVTADVEAFTGAIDRAWRAIQTAAVAEAGLAALARVAGIATSAAVIRVGRDVRASSLAIELRDATLEDIEIRVGVAARVTRFGVAVGVHTAVIVSIAARVGRIAVRVRIRAGIISGISGISVPFAITARWHQQGNGDEDRKQHGSIQSDLHSIAVTQA